MVFSGGNGAERGAASWPADILARSAQDGGVRLYVFIWQGVVCLCSHVGCGGGLSLVVGSCLAV